MGIIPMLGKDDMPRKQTDAEKLELIILRSTTSNTWIPVPGGVFHDHHFAGTTTHLNIAEIGPHIAKMAWRDEDRL